MIEAYPLHWPVGYQRSFSHQIRSSNFSDKSLFLVNDLLQAEIKRLGGRDVIVSSNIPLNKNGFPRSDYQKKKLTDKGVAVYFTYQKKQNVLCCDAWDCIEDNMYAIVKSIEAMRGLERWKVSQIMERTFTGFAALPEPESGKSCWDILGIQPTKRKQDITEAYHAKAKYAHPDNGGKASDFHELQDARDMANKYAEQ